MLSNAYFLAKFRFDTAENEPAKNLKNLLILLTLTPLTRSTDGSHARQVGEASAFATGDRVTFDTAQEQQLAALLFKA